MGNYWLIVHDIIQRCDIILEVLDARLVDETRNQEAEEKVRKAGKALIFVINKCDLVSKHYLDQKKKELHPCVFVSSTQRLGSKKLRDEIMIQYNKMKFDFSMVRVGVIGYPNTGKSSIINMLKGKRSAPTSSFSGFTKGKQEVKITKRITMFDTPGIIPFMEKDAVKHALIGSKNVQELKDPELVCYELFSHLEKIGIDIAEFYGVQKGLDEADTLEKIAIRLRKLKSGGVPDTETTARMIIQDWQKGKIRVKT